MAKFIRHLILQVMLLCAVGAHSFCAGATPASEQITVQFTVFARHNLKGLFFRPAAENSAVELAFSGQRRSPLYAYKGGHTLSFYNSKSADVEVARVVVPDGATRVLILFAPLAQPNAEGHTHLAFAINDSDSFLPPGSAVVLNVSGYEYQAMMGGRQVTLPQGLSSKVSINGKVTLQLAMQNGDSWLNAGFHEFTVGDKARTYVVLFPPRSQTGIAPLIRPLVDEQSSSKG